MTRHAQAEALVHAAWELLDAMEAMDRAQDSLDRQEARWAVTDKAQVVRKLLYEIEEA